MKFLNTAILLLLGCVAATSDTNLGGIVGNLTLDTAGNPFIVADNLTVPSGKTLVIKAGSVLLFKPFTGIIIEGSLIAEGTLHSPVVFTSIYDSGYGNDTTQLPNPFDWNGILVTQKAEKVKLSDFVLAYSVYGVRSRKEDLTITNGTFSQNGQFHFTVRDMAQPVVDGLPYSFGTSKEPSPVPDTLHRQLQRVHAHKPRQAPSWARPVSLTAGGTGVVALGIAAALLYLKTQYARDYRVAVAQDEMDRLVERQETALTGAIISAIAGAVLLPSGVGLYVWDRRTTRPPKLSVAPVVGQRNGVQVTYIFRFEHNEEP